MVSGKKVNFIFTSVRSVYAVNRIHRSSFYLFFRFDIRLVELFDRLQPRYYYRFIDEIDFRRSAEFPRIAHRTVFLIIICKPNNGFLQ